MSGQGPDRRGMQAMRWWPRGAWLGPLLGVLLLLSVALLGCRPARMPGPAVCSERDRCEGKLRCVMGRCREPGTQPVSTKAEQLVFAPVDLAWAPGVGRPGQQAYRAEDLPDPIVLGRVDRDVVRLYLRFAADWPRDARVQRALLRLTPDRACKAQPGRLELQVAPIEESWSSHEVARGRRPQAGPPQRLAERGVTPPRPMLLDVTELVRGWADAPERHHGLILIGRGDSASGACVRTADDQGPRLEVYLSPEKEGDDDDDGEDDEEEEEDDDDDEDDDDEEDDDEEDDDDDG